MNSKPPNFPSSAPLPTFLLVLFLIFAAPRLSAQSIPPQSDKAGPPPAANSAPAEQQLRQRLQAAEKSRATGDPQTIAAANQRVISLALRELAHLRLLESSFLPAIELYQRSLTFEDIPDTHVDLAIADLQAGRLDDALGESRRALSADPQNARALGVEGRALAGQQDYQQAAQILERATALSPDFDTSYLLGIYLLQTKTEKNKGRAAEVFADIARQTGDSGSLHVLLGRAYRDAGDMPGAIREFQRAIALDSTTPHAHYFLGLAHLALNEWKATPQVGEEFQKELKNYPRDYLANYMMGFLDSGARSYAESDRYLQIAAEINPQWPEPWLYLGLNAYAQSDLIHAEQYFRKAIEYTGTDESRSNFQIRRAYVSLGRILANSGRAEESETFLTKARDLQNKTMEQTQQNISQQMALAGGAGSAAAIVPLSPRSETQAAPLTAGLVVDPFARLDATTLAKAHLDEKQRAQADAQETQLRAALALGFNDLATSEALRRDYSAALAHYREAQHWDPAIPGLQKNLGLAAFRSGNYPEALPALSSALQQSPSDLPLRAILGMAYFGSDHFAEAVKTFMPLGAAGMRDATVGYAWSASAARTGDLQQSAKVLREFEQTNPSGDTLLLVGQLWIEIGDYTRAVEALHRLSVAEPSRPRAHYFSGQAYIRSERWPEAAQEFQSELAISPSDSEARYSLGYVDLQQSRTDEAMKLFEQVLSAQPDHANAHYQLGKIFLDRGDLQQAVEHLETAARLNPQSDYVHYQLQSAYRKEARLADADRELELYKTLKARAREQAATKAQSP